MKTFKNKSFLFLIIWILIFALSVFIITDVGNVEDYNDDVVTIRNSLIAKEAKAKELLSKESDIYFKWGVKGLYSKQNEQYLLNYTQRQDIYFCCYKNDSAIFWSRGDFLPLSLNTSKYTNSTVYFINNTWVYLLVKKINNIAFVAFIPIKKEYPFENNYLKNFYYQGFDLTYDYHFSTLPQTAAFYITDAQQNFLFSIEPQTSLSLTLRPYLFLFVLCLLYILVHITLIYKKHLISVFFVLVGLLILRLGMMLKQNPESLYSLPLFNAEIFAYKFPFNFLGDAFFNTWWLLLFIEWFLLWFKRKIFTSRFYIYSLLLLASALFLYWIILWNKLIWQSNLSFDLFNIDTFLQLSLLAYLIIGMWAWIIASVLYFIFKYLYKTQQKRYKFFFIGLFLFVLPLILYVLQLGHFSVLIVALYLLIIWFFVNRRLPQIAFILISAFLFSFFIVLYSFHLNHQKRINLQQVVAFSLSNEKDYLAQMLLMDMEKKLAEDKIIKSLLQKAYDNRYEIYQYLKDNYFNGFWNKYDLQVTICNTYDNLRLMPSNEYCRCFDFFNKQINSRGSRFDSHYFYSIDNEYGDVSYLGVFSYNLNMIPDSGEKKIFLELYRKLLPSTPGYPDLLVDLKTYKSLSKQWAHYAKYKTNRLIQQNGDFQYPYNYIYPNIKNGSFILINKDNFEHFIYAPNKKIRIVVSAPVVKWSQYLWSIIYVFNIFILLFFIPYGIIYYLKKRQQLLYGFRFKYIRSFLLILVFSYLIIGFYTLIYFNNQYNQKNYEALKHKQKIIVNALNEYLGSFKNIYQKPIEELSRQLVTLSNIFFADINLYDAKGYLIASSRPALFEKGLKSKLIDAEALAEIVKEHKETFIDIEKIGSLEYLASYTALYSNGKLQAILQLPYFTEKEKNMQEITQVFINLINIYILFIAIAFGIILLIANGILRPLTVLHEYFKKIKPNQKIKPIIYTEKDEIAPLINEYNRILEELSISTQKLLLSERESTWRDIAKQIAHEIKNPLTPMKLNIQYLQKLKKENGHLPDELLQNTMNSLLEQIESLSSIASAFSAFANLPRPQFEMINLVEVVKNIALLFKTHEYEVKVNSNMHDCFIEGDKDYLKRIITNLVTNALQAIPIDREKNIYINIEAQSNKIILSVSDNGIGIAPDIADNVFKPSFTTKSSGMGMGLSLVKNMVEAMKGNIYFRSEVNKGTTFYIEFKCYNQA